MQEMDSLDLFDLQDIILYADDSNTCASCYGLCCENPPQRIAEWDACIAVNTLFEPGLFAEHRSGAVVQAAGGILVTIGPEVAQIAPSG